MKTMFSVIHAENPKYGSTEIDERPRVSKGTVHNIFARYSDSGTVGSKPTTLNVYLRSPKRF